MWESCISPSMLAEANSSKRSGGPTPVASVLELPVERVEKIPPTTHCSRSFDASPPFCPSIRQRRAVHRRTWSSFSMHAVVHLTCHLCCLFAFCPMPLLVRSTSRNRSPRIRSRGPSPRRCRSQQDWPLRCLTQEGHGKCKLYIVPVLLSISYFFLLETRIHGL